MSNTYSNALRILAIDAVERANSGHPGAVMGMADIATVLWKHFVKHDPNNPTLPARDRVILSNGHASMMLYGALHLLGYKHFTMDSLKNFRQLGSITSGHPEYEPEAGIEITTGPLGQGLAGAVGMALAEKICAEHYNKEDATLIDNYTYVFLGDGCLMEGISHEVCSFAGTLGLNKLIALYDSNNISIDGTVDTWFAEDVAERFRAYGWNVIEDINGYDKDAIYKSIAKARKSNNAPTLICFDTVIGYGSPNKAGSAKAHGSPLGKEEVALVRKAYGWEYEPFFIPQDVYEYWNAEEKGAEHTKEYNTLCEEYQKKYPKEWEIYKNRKEGAYTQEVKEVLGQCKKYAFTATKAQATRISSQEILQSLVPVLPQSIGGSADLTPSVGTFTTASLHIEPSKFSGNYISYGVREFGMYAIMNGLALYENTFTYGGTFLVFTDYAKPALRLGALMKLRTVWIVTHDTIGVGEDGPTHQPIEHLTMLRTTPNVHVWRPADLLESVYAWEFAVKHTTSPVALVLSRQNLSQLPKEQINKDDIAKGAYIVIGIQEEIPSLILLATGSEVALAIEAEKVLREKNSAIRVVSMPSTTVFDMQENSYKETILPLGVPIIAIEAGEGTFWHKYIKGNGAIIGMNGFGASGKGEELFTHFGFTVKTVVEQAEKLLNKYV